MMEVGLVSVSGGLVWWGAELFRGCLRVVSGGRLRVVSGGRFRVEGGVCLSEEVVVTCGSEELLIVAPGHEVVVG